MFFFSLWFVLQAAPPRQNSPEVEIEVESGGLGSSSAAGLERASAHHVDNAQGGEGKVGDHGYGDGVEDDEGANVEEIDTHCDELWEDIQESMGEVRRIEQAWSANRQLMAYSACIAERISRGGGEACCLSSGVGFATVAAPSGIEAT